MDACAAIVRTLMATDGYPSFLPGADVVAFLDPSNALGAWVAVSDDAIVGHVAARAGSAPSASELASSALGVDPQRLGFVSRLMVHPDARRRGIARMLLERAIAEIRAGGRVAVLDVVVTDLAAIALYRRERWTLLGRTSFTSRNGRVFDELVFAAPGRDAAM